MADQTQQNTPLYGRLLIRLTKPVPNFDLGFIKPVRRKAVDSLCLPKGGRVWMSGAGRAGVFLSPPLPLRIKSTSNNLGQ